MGQINQKNKKLISNSCINARYLNGKQLEHVNYLNLKKQMSFEDINEEEAVKRI